MFSSFKADYFFYTFLQMKWQEGTLEVELIWEDFMNMLPSNVCDNVINLKTSKKKEKKSLQHII